MNVSYTKPILKWVGGKSQILNKVLSLFPSKINNYYEPFLGGGSVLLGLLKEIEDGRIELSGKIYVSDLNSNLINFYNNIKNYTDIFIEECRKIVEEFKKCGNGLINRNPQTITEALVDRENYYYWIRKKFNSLEGVERTLPRASAMFLFLNRVGFRGLYREGPNGFNVPYGNYENPTIYEKEHIERIGLMIKEVEFHEWSFEQVFPKMGSGDFIYLDPPYAPEKNSSFVNYIKDGFEIETHKKLFELCGLVKEKGGKFLLSESNVTLVRDSFKDDLYETIVLTAKRAINSKNPTSTTTEVLIRGLISV